MPRRKWFLAAMAFLSLWGCGTDSEEGLPEGAHPRSSARCENCHEFGAGDDRAPKVIPKVPDFAVPVLQEHGYRGHPTLSCAGTVRDDGQITGCHRIEGGRRSYLVIDLNGLPMDEFCGRCHAAQRQAGRHHPSHVYDRDRDGSFDRLVIPYAGQRVFGEYAPSHQSEPLRSYPDAIVTDPVVGEPQVLAVLPLASVPNPFGGSSDIAEGVVSCVTCHNPHFGYSVSARSAAELEEILGNDAGGDALLRLSPYNTLCDACHGFLP